MVMQTSEMRADGSPADVSTDVAGPVKGIPGNTCARLGYLRV